MDQAMKRNGHARGSGNPGVLDRVMAILDLFSLDEPEWSLTGISRSTGMAVSTTHRLLGDMCAHGMLERLENGNYCIGLRLSEIGMLSHSMLYVSDAASRALDDLNLATGQQVQLVALQGTEGVVLGRRMERGRRLPTFYYVGGPLPLIATGTGRVLLAYADDRVRRTVLADEGFPWATFSSPRPTVRSIVEDCARIRRTGYCVFEPEGHPVWSIAAPIFDSRHRVLASVGILYSPRDGDPRFASLVCAAARSVSKRLATQDRRRHLPAWDEGLG